MYSISSVNEGKYRILSDTLNVVFESRPSSPTPIEHNNPQVPVTPSNNLLINIPMAERAPSPEDNDNSLTIPDNPELDALSEEISQTVKTLIDEELISVKKTDFWLEIDIKSSILFSSGDALLSEDAEDVLAAIARLLDSYPNDIQVEGFTDNRPISSKKFPSNWELSSSRAASVVHLFEEEGIDPKRMQAIGYSQYRPIADNTTVAGRNANRRVNLVVLGEGDPRQIMQQRMKQLNQPLSKPSSDKKQSFNPIFNVQ